MLLTTFYISHKSSIKTFLLQFINNCLKSVNMTHYYILAYNPCKCIDAFKIKHNFYYKNINNQSIYNNKKIVCNICIHMNKIKIKHNFYYKNINNYSIIFFKVNVIGNILKFLSKFNNTNDLFFFFLNFEKIEFVVIFIEYM